MQCEEMRNQTDQAVASSDDAHQNAEQGASVAATDDKDDAAVFMDEAGTGRSRIGSSSSQPSIPTFTTAAAVALVGSPVVDKDCLCPICFETIKEAFITRCGHSFCYLCIVHHLETRKECPTCANSVSREGIFPNFLLNRLLEKQIQNFANSSSPVRQFQENLIRDKDLKVSDINALLGTLMDAKRRMEADEREIETDVLYDFLSKTKEQKAQLLHRLSEEIQYLNEDLEQVEAQRRELSVLRESTTMPSSSTAEVPITPEDELAGARKRVKLTFDGGDLNTYRSMSNIAILDAINNKKRKVQTHFEDLQACYFDNRRNSDSGNLRSFTDSLSKFTRFSRFHVLASLKYGDMFNSSSIVSSIEFDRDDEYFATAGVTKKIKIFEYGNIINEPVHVHFPLREMSCRSKISCLSWNSYIKSQIASSDYEGIITLWDAFTGVASMQFEEHEKRAWSVDFSRTDPRRLVSASDDTKVKIWSTNMEQSTLTIESKANICCAKFNPESANHVAFGSADHHVHYYDLRKHKEPLFIMKGHRKAVSYVKFLNRDEIVSASTDSTLKLSSISANGECKRTFTGHANEKNFVGLTANGEYISCGSETNAVYTYYKALSKPVVSYKFGSANPHTGEESDEDVAQFVSSLCWKKDSNILLAANSQGTIKVLELV